MSNVLGIDLGTSNSCVALFQEGKAVVAPDRQGRAIQPSIVYFKENGSVIVGADAKPYIIKDPQNTVFSAKRLIGRKIFSAEVKKAQALMPYEIVEGENQTAAIKIRDRIYSLEEISAMILRKMKSIAEDHFKESFTHAIITVPAYFNDNQRAATQDAGKIAGLNVLRIINEPTAASLSYGYGKNLRQKVVVYDLGGGTFDISILELGDGIFEVVSTAGDTYLGGDDFEDRILDWVSKKFADQHQVDLRDNRNILQQIKDAAETAKIELSKSESTQIFIPAVQASSEGFIDIDYPLKRSEFNHLVSDLVQKTFQVCDEAMQMARFTPSDIEGVILVGGSTRIPIIQQGVKRYFHQDPMGEVDPDQVVAMGAAIQGSLLSGKNNSEVVLVDLTPLSFGIEIRGGLVDKIIEINTPIPVDQTKIFTTSENDQENVTIRVFQGEHTKAAENEPLGEFVLEGLRKAPAGDISIAVQFEIDTNGILSVTAKDVETGRAQSVKLQASGRLSPERIAELKAKTVVSDEDGEEAAAE